MNNTGKKILGIDPGLDITGWAVISQKYSKRELLKYGYIKTEPDKSLQERLEIIYDSMKNIINEILPDEAAIEEIFFTKKATTQANTTYARGIILLALEKEKIKTYSYNPRTVKQNISGNGNADKKQMQKIIQIIFSLKNPLKPDDIADAVAIALCHLRLSSFQQLILKKI